VGKSFFSASKVPPCNSAPFGWHEPAVQEYGTVIFLKKGIFTDISPFQTRVSISLANMYSAKLLATKNEVTQSVCWGFTDVPQHQHDAWSPVCDSRSISHPLVFCRHALGKPNVDRVRLPTLDIARLQQ